MFSNLPKIEWVFDSDCKGVDYGIYAVLYAWDIAEGIHSGAYVANGEGLITSIPIVAYSNETFGSISAASEWASDNNPDNDID